MRSEIALAGRTVSPITCDSDLRSQNLKAAGWSIFCCTCRRPNQLPGSALPSGIWNLESIGRPAVSGLAALWCSDFPLLPAALINFIRSRQETEAAITRLAPLQGIAIITRVFKRYSHELAMVNRENPSTNLQILIRIRP